MTLDAVLNFAKVTVSTGYDSSATAVVLASGDGIKLPNPASDGEFNLIWWNVTDYIDPTDDPNREIVRVTGKTLDTLTIVRAQESTLASTKNNLNKTYRMILGITAKMISDIQAVLGIQDVKEEQVNGTDGYHWTLVNTPITGSIKLYASGPRLFEGSSKDYTVNGADITTSAQWPVGSIFADYKMI